MISILLPIYNTNAEYLNECLSSIFNQTFKEYEIIAVNNGSDNQETIEFLSSLLTYNNIKIISCERIPDKKNLSIALNRGLQYCQYDYVARIDSDDVMHPQRLEKQINHLIINNYLTVLGSQMYHIQPPFFTPQLPLIIDQEIYYRSHHFLNHPTVTFVKEHILNVGGYKEYPNHIPEDLILWIKLLKTGHKLANLSEALVGYRNNPQSLSYTDSKHFEWFDEIRKAIEA